ncbi:chromate transporter [Ideonella sp. B7]|uniref:chromate transporter n=1 Tax=Ideonella benzenivorans TaxID=2831643 RepID=UPI001CECE1C8|nr:chromate transporter [Ideonella benzenivorans]MCA6216372.1 chromate transporter [Ideonella benzenivorans]
MPPAEGDRPGPASNLQLFTAFSRLSLMGFGGVLPIAQRELVERLGWLRVEEFAELLSVGQVLPGPNVVNLSLMVGDRYFGLRGALAALAGMLLLPLILVLAFAALYQQFAAVPAVAGAVRGMGAVSAGLVMAIALKLLPALRRNPLGRRRWVPVTLLVVLATGWWRWPLVAVIVLLGGLSCLLAWRCLGQTASTTEPTP